MLRLLSLPLRSVCGHSFVVDQLFVETTECNPNDLHYTDDISRRLVPLSRRKTVLCIATTKLYEFSRHHLVT